MNNHSRMLICLCLAIGFFSLFVTGTSTNTWAQAPRLEVYFDQALTQKHGYVWPDPYHPGPDYYFTLYFATSGLNIWMTAIEFSVP